MGQPVIIDAVRTPIGRFGGGLLEHSAADLATHVLRAVLERNSIAPEAVDEVILGQVIQGGAGMNMARQAAMAAGLPVEVCAWTVNMACASGLKAIALAANNILLDEGAFYLAGGAESMSNVPYYLPDMRWGHKLGSATVVDGIMDEGLRCAVSGLGMGLTAEEIARESGITREAMDAWALRSQNRALAAIAAGRFTDEIIPVPRRKDEPLAVDEHPRETSLEALARLKPAFCENGTVTAGNASGINDGAAALLVADLAQARQHGMTARARIVGWAQAGIDPRIMGLGPVNAVRALCERTGLTIADFDLVELNEAFAVQALAVIRELGLDEERVNVNGSGIALGHPIGATGARIVTTLLYEMEKRDVQRGLATLCVGGGMGYALALDREMTR